MKIEITQSKTQLAIKHLNDELSNIINENKINKINKITSNGNLCSLLQDGILYSLKGRLNKNERFYSIGNFNELELDVDVLQLWTDNKIYLKKDDDIICEIEIIDEKDMLI